jgi:hypothetical protein
MDNVFYTFFATKIAPIVFTTQILYYWKLNWLRCLTAYVNLGLTIFPNVSIEIKTFVYRLMLCHCKIRITKSGGHTDGVQYVHKPTPMCPCRLPLKFQKMFVSHISQTRIYNRLLNIPRSVVSRVLKKLSISFARKIDFSRMGFPRVPATALAWVFPKP